MSIGKNFVLLSISALIACSSSPSKDKAFQTLDSMLITNNSSWRLVSPKTKINCELLLAFGGDNKMLMKYGGRSFEGYYEIDSVLTNYITINILNKEEWDNSCDVNPDYLSLYDEDTQFSYTLIDNKLYFNKSEKAIVFERVSN